MNVLLTGATGFIGSRLHRALSRAGHHVVAVGRRAPLADLPHTRWLKADFAEQRSIADWLPYLAGIDVVVNAVGLFRETGRQSFEALHVQAPSALFEACAELGIARVVQVSALGADANASSAYHLSKKRADDLLLGLPLCAIVAQPSLVHGGDGLGARWFTMLASLPVLPLPGGGKQSLQPIHVDDLVLALCNLVVAEGYCGRRVPLVGPRPVTLVEYLQALREAMQLPPARCVAVPRALVGLAARIGDHWPGSLFDSASWKMLERGNVADPAAMRKLLRREPREPQRFIPNADAALQRTSARVAWLLPLLRVSLALVWIATGIISLVWYPAQDSHALLARVGVPAAFAPPMLYGAASLDLLLGIATLLPLHRRAWLWLAQMALIVGYTTIAGTFMPEFWLHPHGPLLKNVPMLALLVALYVLDSERRTSQ
jgi:uncharacterized protein YbjT (DUF2867 family)/uncharacterized membrane protein YphA (DoxX/SURF4 family)